MKPKRTVLAGVAATVLAVSAPAFAEDVVYQSSDGAVVVSGGVGLMWITAGEYVFNNTRDDTKLSKLDWESSNVPVFNGTARIELPHRFLLKGSVELGIGGDGYMTDYDWIFPFATGYGSNDWSDRSQHDATELDHFWGGSIALGYQLIDRPDLTLDLLGGAKYRDVQWTAWGGDYIYSYYSRHDSIGSWPDDEIGITYQQKIPSAFVGLDASWIYGRWTFSGSVEGGFTFSAEALDDHWQRPLFFKEDLHQTPTLALSGQVAYALNERLSVHVGGSYDEVFETRSDSETYDPTTGRTYYDENLSGAAQRTFKVLVGLSGRF